MSNWLIEVETSSLKTYRINADNETNARMTATMADFSGSPEPVEEHEQVRIKSCYEVDDDE